MRFLTLIARNLLRRRARTLLTVVGLAVAIAAVVDLLGISWGFERSFMAIYEAKGIDLVVVRAGISNQLSSTLDQSLAAKLRRDRRGGRGGPVADGRRRLRGGQPGQRPGQRLGDREPALPGLRILEGRAFRPGEGRVAMLGRVLALNLGKTVGDDARRRRRAVPGRRDLRERQPVRERRPDRPAGDAPADDGPRGAGHGIRRPGADRPTRAAIADAGEADRDGEIPGVAAVPARDYVQRDVQIRLAKAMAWATAASPWCSDRSGCSTR